MDLNNLKSDPIVVIGGGFGGLSTVKALLAKSVGTSIILIDQSSRFVFKPLLYELLSGETQLWEVAPKFSELASELGFIFLQDRVVEVDELTRKLITSSGMELKYSQLVISTGVTTDYSFVEDLEEYAIGFSDVKDALRIKDLISMINHSSQIQDPLVISGAGPTGVELACKISDLVNNQIQIYLVDKGKKILSNCKSFNREEASAAIAKRNIKCYFRHYIKSLDENQLELDNGESNPVIINYSGLLWTSGLKLNNGNLLNNFLNGYKRVNVNNFLQSNENQNIFFVGDITFNENNPAPASAQVAMQQGDLTARNIISLRHGLALKTFEFEDRGEMLSLGIGNASITGYGLTIGGPLAFQMRRLAYFSKMPGFSLSLKSTGLWLFNKKLINHLFS